MKVTVQGFRVFKEPQTIDIKPITILTGKNNSGKSSFGKAMMLLGDSNGQPIGSNLTKWLVERDPTNFLSLGNFDSVINPECTSVIYTVPFEITELSDKPFYCKLEYVELNGRAVLSNYKILTNSHKILAKSVNRIDKESNYNKSYGEDEERVRKNFYEGEHYIHFKNCADLLIAERHYLLDFWDFIDNNRDKYPELENIYAEVCSDNKIEHSSHFSDVKHAISDDIEGTKLFKLWIKYIGITHYNYKNWVNLIRMLNKVTFPNYINSEDNNVLTFIEKIKFYFNPDKVNSKFLSKNKPTIESFWKTQLFGGKKWGNNNFEIDHLDGSMLNDAISEMDLPSECKDYLRDISGFNQGFIWIGDGEVEWDFIDGNSFLCQFSKYISDAIISNITLFFKMYRDYKYLPSVRSAMDRAIIRRGNNQYLEKLIDNWHSEMNFGEEAWTVNAGFIKKWLKEFGIGSSVIIKEIKDIGAMKVFIEDHGKVLNLKDLGYGFSELLPIIMAASELPPMRVHGKNKISPMERTILIIEEPELHLHPNLQSKLADLFCDIIRNYEVNLIVETHSEYLIRRLQYLIASFQLFNDETKIYYFDKANNPVASEIRISKDGQLLDNFGPGFLDEASNLIQDLYKTNLN